MRHTLDDVYQSTCSELRVLAFRVLFLEHDVGG
jgi:hypothetical protein